MVDSPLLRKINLKAIQRASLERTIIAPTPAYSGPDTTPSPLPSTSQQSNAKRVLSRAGFQTPAREGLWGKKKAAKRARLVVGVDGDGDVKGEGTLQAIQTKRLERQAMRAERRLRRERGEPSPGEKPSEKAGVHLHVPPSAMVKDYVEPEMEQPSADPAGDAHDVSDDELLPLDDDMERERRTNSMPKAEKPTRKAAALPWMRVSLRATPGTGLELSNVPGLNRRVSEALRKTWGVTELFPVQTAVWTHSAGGIGSDHDICVCAPTGSGKTLAYALPLANRVAYASQQEQFPAIRALIVVPTRDLARQVFSVLEPLFTSLGLKIALLAGGCTLDDEAASVGLGKSLSGIPQSRERFLTLADALVVTPGRLTAHIRDTPHFDLAFIQFLVVDEADRLLRQAYQEWLEHLQVATGFCEGNKRIVKMIVSATLTRDPAKVDKLALVNPRFLTLGSEDQRYSLPKNLVENKLVCPPAFKPHTLLALIIKLQGASMPKKPILVFAATVDAAHRLAVLLQEIHRFDSRAPIAVEYSSHVRESARIAALHAFRTGAASILVASDAATRGLDIENIYAVVNYDAPVYAKTYVHRAGRTARAGKGGIVVTMLRHEEVRHFKSMLRKADNNFVNDFLGISRDDVDLWKPAIKAGLLAVASKITRYPGIRKSMSLDEPITVSKDRL